MTISRRRFITSGIGVLGLCLSPAEIFSTQVMAAPSARRKLVVIHLSGGNDGLNTVVPYGFGHYYDARPDLAIPAAEVLALSGSLGLHAAMSGMAGLYAGGKLAILQAVGYPDASRSHFRSSEIWQTAQPQKLEHRGWLASHQSSLSPTELCWRGSFAQRLQFVVRSIGTGQATTVYEITVDGFDTHANQLRVHAPLLQEVSDAITAFQNELEAQNLDRNVVTMVYSEFGRRLGENGGCGTDHGTAGPVFVIGSAVRGGIYGEGPDLARLDNNGDLKYNLDFRTIYATIADRWLGADSAEILGQTFEHVRFV